jgi:hypothetical protein
MTDHRTHLRKRIERGGTDTLISILLQGYVFGQKRYYLDDGSPDDERARAALADLLRSVADWHPQWGPQSEEPRNRRRVLFWLADLFAPVPHREERRLKFVRRSAGTPTNTLKNNRVAWHIYEHVWRGGTQASGIRSAAAEFKLGEQRIKKIWRALGPTLGVLPPRRNRRNRVVAQYICDHVLPGGGTVESGVESAANKFGLETEHVWLIWHVYEHELSQSLANRVLKWFF